MSNYTKSTDFARKDTLPTGNASKIIKGTEINDELNAISTAIASKAEEAGSAAQNFAANDLTVAGDATVTGDVTCATLNDQPNNGTVIAWAYLNLDGTTNQGSGLSAVRDSTGVYSITLDTAYTADKYAVSTQTEIDVYTGEVDSITSTGFRIRTYDRLDGNALDSQPIGIIVVG